MTLLDGEIKMCVVHVDSTDVRYTPMGDLIAKCLLVRICATYEVAIVALVREKMGSVDNAVFCEKTERVLTRFSLYSHELEQKILKWFGMSVLKI